VIPYPPGFPIMVPGQVVTKEIIAFMRKLDVRRSMGTRPRRVSSYSVPRRWRRMGRKNSSH